MQRARRPRIVDLTRTISHEMPNFPGEPRPGFIRFGDLGDIGFRCHQILMPTHFGTHADAPSHFLPSGRPIARMRPDAYVGPAALLDVRRRPDATRVTRTDLERAWERAWERARPGGEPVRRVVVNTGWAERATGARYFRGFPGLTREAATWLVRSKRVTLVGLDLPSVHPTDYRRVHVILFRGNVAVVEGLVRLGEVRVSRFFLVALPLPFAGLDGSPVRALAILGDPSVL